MSRRLGLIIGANNYQDAIFQPLHYAENDARALAQWLVNVKGGRWSPANVQLVQGPHATKELAESLIAQMCLTLAEPDDLALIYFAGHAFLDERSGDGYLALSNTRYQNPTTGLHLPTLMQQILSRSRAAHILVILDCFQNGALWQARRQSPYDAMPLIGLEQREDCLLLCSCRGNESVQEAGERNLGMFMHRMILGLCGPASDPSTGQISAQGLYAYLSSMTGEQQRPQLAGQAHAPMILVGDAAADAPLPPQATPGAGPPMRGGNGLFKQPMGRAATAQMTAPIDPPPATPTTVPIEPPPQQPGLLSQAQQMVMAQNYVEALALVDQVLQMQPQDGSALVLKAQILGTVGRFPEALLLVDQLTQLNPNNALAWSMRAVLLSNMQQFQDALIAVDRSLSLDPGNSETGAIKSNIMTAMATAQNQGTRTDTGHGSARRTRGGVGSFLIGTGLQISGLVLGIVGILLPLSRLPAVAGLVLAGLGMSLLCVSAARGTYHHGWMHLLPTFLLSMVAAGIIIFGGLLNLVVSAHTPANARLLSLLNVHPSFVVPVIVLGAWLIAAIVVPPLLAIIGLVSGIVVRWHTQRG